jgi:prevent-host-death family protein
MLTVGTFEAKTRFSALLDAVERGEEVTITRHGEPVALMVAIRAGEEKARVRALIEEIKATRKGLALGSGVSVKQLIEEGRRYKG